MKLKFKLSSLTIEIMDEIIKLSLILIKIFSL